MLSVQFSYAFLYDRMDNIVNKATEHGPYTYNYDSLYRLAGAVSPVLPQESFSYDPVGNRLTSASATNWTYIANNELQSYNGVTFQYDLNGNTTQKNDNGTVLNFLYNEDDRLTEVKDSSGGVIATYYYDPFGRRLWKEAGGTTTYFMYSDEGLIAEFDGIGSQTKSYGYAPNSTWTTNPHFMKRGEEYFFYHNDHLGTPQKMTSVSGAVVWSAKYESFGKAEVDPASSVQNNLRFPGQYYDKETGLHFNRYRHYDATGGRFSSSDPSLNPSGNRDIPYLLHSLLSFPQELGGYHYVRNNPALFIDPLGLKCCQNDDECPCGSWTGSGVNYGGFLGIAGLDSTHITMKCKCSSAIKKVVVTCNRWGIGLGGSIQKYWTKVWGACSSSEIKWGGLETGLADGYIVIGGSTSGSGGLDEGSFSGGVGFGMGVAGYLYSDCKVILEE